MKRNLFLFLGLVALPLFSFLNVVEVYLDSFFHFFTLSIQVTIVILAFLGTLGKEVEEIALEVIVGFWIGCISFSEVYEKLNYLSQLKNALYQGGDELFSCGNFDFFSLGELSLWHYSSFWERLNNFSLFTFNFWLTITLMILIIVIKRKMNIKKVIIGGLAGLFIIGIIGWAGKNWGVNFNRVSTDSLGFYLYGEEKAWDYFWWLHFQGKEAPVEIKLDAVSKTDTGNPWEANFFLEDPDIKKFGNLVQENLKLKIKLLSVYPSNQFLDPRLKIIEYMIKGIEYFSFSYLKRVSRQSNQSYAELVDLSRKEFLKAFLKFSSGNIYAYQALAGK